MTPDGDFGAVQHSPPSFGDHLETLHLGCEARNAETFDRAPASRCGVKARSDVVVFDTRGKSRQTDLTFEHEWAYVWTFGKGRLTEWQAYYEKDAALRAAGLEE